MRLLGIVVLLVAFTAPVYADSMVDWSAYVETNPSRQLTKTTGPSKTVAAAPAATHAKPAKRVAKSKVKNKKVKARSKRAGRRK